MVYRAGKLIENLKLFKPMESVFYCLNTTTRKGFVIFTCRYIS